MSFASLFNWLFVYMFVRNDACHCIHFRVIQLMKQIWNGAKNSNSNLLNLIHLQTRYLSTSGGATVGDATRNIMRRMFTNGLSVQCNWKGRGGKQAFGRSAIKKIVCGKWKIPCSILYLIATKWLVFTNVVLNYPVHHSGDQYLLMSRLLKLRHINSQFVTLLLSKLDVWGPNNFSASCEPSWWGFFKTSKKFPIIKTWCRPIFRCKSFADIEISWDSSHRRS